MGWKTWKGEFIEKGEGHLPQGEEGTHVVGDDPCVVGEQGEEEACRHREDGENESQRTLEDGRCQKRRKGGT